MGGVRTTIHGTPRSVAMVSAVRPLRCFGTKASTVDSMTFYFAQSVLLLARHQTVGIAVHLPANLQNIDVVGLVSFAWLKHLCRR